MKLKIIWGYIPPIVLDKVHIVEDRPGFLDHWGGDYEKALMTLDTLDCAYFRTYNPLFSNYLDEEYALENTFIWDGEHLKQMSVFPELWHKVQCMSVGEALADTDFSKEWKQ